MKWIISIGHGLKLHSAHKSLEDALRCVHEKIMRGSKSFDSIQWQTQTGDDNGLSDGTLTCLCWDSPGRKMTADEIQYNLESEQIDKRTATAWKKLPPMVTDWDRVHKIVTFVAEPHEHVSICREDRHRQYLCRSGYLNDKRKDSCDFEALIASI